MKDKLQVGALRKYYYEKYENFQYQLMIIAGGTLTVFISLNKETYILPLYKWGFALLGFSLITGTISILMFQLYIVFIVEYDALKNELQKSTEESHKIGLSILKKIVSNGYFGSIQIAFALLQLPLFLIGLILITLGLIKI